MDDSGALSTSLTRGEFSVYWWDPFETYHVEKRFCGAQEAVETAHSLTTRPAAMMGIVRRVMITDADDCTNFVWEYGKGVTFK